MQQATPAAPAVFCRSTEQSFLRLATTPTLLKAYGAEGLSAGEAAQRLSLPKSTLETWVRAAKGGKLGNIGKNRRPLTEVEVELAKTKRELAMVRMERDILKKAAAYFAKESLPGTR